MALHFGRQAQANRLVSVPWRQKTTGAPILSDALAYFDCRLRHRLPAGDHELAVGQVVEGGSLKLRAIPLVYRAVAHLDGSADLFPKGFVQQS